MQFAALQTFLAIVETGSLVQAAGRMNVTQSTVTARIQQLERELGQTLLVRRRSGAELTSAGFKFLRYARLMGDMWRQAKLETALPPGIAGVCNLGCHMDLWQGIGRSCFETASAASPPVAVSAWPGDQHDIERWLGSGLIDLAICYQPRVRENQIVTLLAEDQLVQVATKPRSRIRFDPDYVYVDAGEDFRERHAASYPDTDIPLKTFGSATWALEHILEHGGSAYLPERLVAPHLANGTLHRVTNTEIFSRKIYLIANTQATENWSWLPQWQSSFGRLAPERGSFG